jgi:hypothetical protein
MQQWPLREVNSHSASQEFPKLLWNPNVQRIPFPESAESNPRFHTILSKGTTWPPDISSRAHGHFPLLRFFQRNQPSPRFGVTFLTMTFLFHRWDVNLLLITIPEYLPLSAVRGCVLAALLHIRRPSPSTANSQAEQLTERYLPKFHKNTFTQMSFVIRMNNMALKYGIALW